MIIDEHRGPILAIALELYGRAVYSHKTHEQERERWSRQVQWMNWINIGLAGATTFAAIISATLKADSAIYVTAIIGVR